MRIEPDYINFKKRIFLQMRGSSVIFLILAVIAEMIYQISVWKLLIVLFAVYLLFFIQAYIYHKYCLKYIETDEADKKVKIGIYKYDKCYWERELPVKDIKVKIYRIIYSLLPWYKMELYKRDEKLISQVETVMWKLNDLKMIRDVINEEKQK